MQKLIECVPNFSEGRDENVIRQITDAIKSVDGATLLDVDPGATTNRTVVTLVGSPEAAVEAAFRGIKKAAELIDMRKHKGAHPRMGATDVCPFIPVSNVSWEEAIECANKLGKRVGDELGIPVYLYEKAAKDKSRSNLAVIRGGEYEGFAEKITKPEWKPDYGPAKIGNAGATVIGAREFLVAYNANLNTKSVRRANSVAFDVREQGRFKTEDGTPSGKKILDKNGEPIREPGMLKHVKAIGWFVKEYGIAQVSMNLTNIDETPLHAAFDACVESAHKRGMRVTGSEIVGMVPKRCLTDAGRYFLRKQKWSEGVSEEELIDIAVKSMGLSELRPFEPNEKVIELKIEGPAGTKKSLVRMNLREFCNETLSDSPAPGGGSVAALMGALGASLGGMVANLSAGKRGWDDKLQFFSDWAVKAQKLKDELLFLVDEDTNAFNKVMDAFALPKGSDEEKKARSAAIESATKYAAEIPLKVMETSSKSYELLAEMAEKGNPASVSDVGVGALATRACVEGAALNVRINLAQLKDEKVKSDLSSKVEKLSADSESNFKKVDQIVRSKIG